MDTAKLKRLLVGLAMLFVIAQIVQPKRTNPPVIPSRTLQAHIDVPQPVQAILSRACNDCHSNLTVWPRYSHVAPISWVVIDDVNEARRHMNFSDWEQQNPKQQSDSLKAMCKDVRDVKMPLVSYRLLHPNARLSQTDIDTLCSWTETALSKSR